MNELTVFYLFSGFAVLSALGVVFAKNPVHAVLLLVLTFVTSAGVWLLLEAEFLAVTLVLVYVGAVMVLFLFVVMMLDIESGGMGQSYYKRIPFGLVVLGGVIALLSLFVGPKYFGSQMVEIPLPSPSTYNNIESLGELLFTRYLLPFEVAGVILLVAMIAAISLTFRGRRAKGQKASKQVFTRKSDRLQVVSMAAEREEGV